MQGHSHTHLQAQSQQSVQSDNFRRRYRQMERRFPIQGIVLELSLQDAIYLQTPKYSDHPRDTSQEVVLADGIGIEWSSRNLIHPMQFQ